MIWRRGFVLLITRELCRREFSRVESILLDAIDPRVDHIRHVGCACLDVVGFGPCEEFIHRAIKKFQPSRKLGSAHRGERHEARVRIERIAGKTSGAEDHRLPECIHLRQVGSPVGSSDIVEDEAEQFVSPHLVVKDIHEALDSTPILEIGRSRWFRGRFHGLAVIANSSASNGRSECTRFVPTAAKRAPTQASAVRSCAIIGTPLASPDLILRLP